uniref:Cytochrome P450 n=1 Tax=Leersia perrieri TaxID=77586 RepID=A0A0D9XIY8_9ORYZ
MAKQLGSKDFIMETDLAKLPYLHGVVKETLRLHLTVPLILREVVRVNVSLGGFHMSNGTGVVVNLSAIGWDERAWSCSHKFIPERFLLGKEVHSIGKDFIYKPFGMGRRMCPRMEYTTWSVPLLLAFILHKFEWRLPGGIAPDEMELSDRYGTMLNRATPVHAAASIM